MIRVDADSFTDLAIANMRAQDAWVDFLRALPRRCPDGLDLDAERVAMRVTEELSKVNELLRAILQADTDEVMACA